ncbi:type VII secretion-associated serine protease mycosin [Micromonospora sp. WMMD975]|uniref:type VII secretion-associated serine protease mycosin n=1 Tax=Micromonospora sp. WMMD975 TaxID=3016087 RepID=UPI00249B7FBC|nr:type VII secretion-associated serine protease mycosin [Micromonospora sp. WMMD975]WFE36803.1 type VII secretion-associated serine protease mycosin [Micromonospora sp. WMMD975]
MPPRRLAGRALLSAAAALAVTAGPLVPPAYAAPAASVATRPPSWVTPRLVFRADQVRDEQWQLAELRAKTAWKTSTGRGVVVAVIDSGVDASHPDLAGQVLPGLDMVSPGGTDEPDPVGHGTTVAGLIAGRADDDRGVVGLAPDAKILPIRVLDAENRYDDALIIAKAVRWAVDNGARVVNLSLGGGGDSPALAAALDYAFARDVVVVACTGNLATSTTTKVWYPAREPGVLAVTGLDRNSEHLWSGAITGRETILSAPATALYGARSRGGYWRVQGTSFAAPLVAATAALVRARYPRMSAGDVVNRLIGTARDLGPTGRDDRFGYGMVDPVAALTADVAAVGHNPLDDNASPGVVGFGPAPGSDPDTRAAAAGQGGDPFGRSQPAGWAARPAGQADRSTPERLWSGLALFVALVTGTALMVRRFRRARR